ncbi:hypothetical protein [Mesonia sp. K4-1]|uniref:hypothetical protein n=1 Tax=Mesonia sp. K4-1 TaxID=2602760 RepID=UPI0011C7D9B6|nr:hypothetical protein [Mesonia sp. K4-1]TXK78912.1 hypothetical protein FT986_03690 [Mesonia sp. K4-1]
MKTQLTVTISIFALILITFLTNPTRDKHTDNANELFLEHVLSEEGEKKSFTDALLSSLSEKMIKANLKIEDYYLFSFSHIHSNSRDKDLQLGFGILGKVFPIADKEDFKEYQKQ